MLRFGQVLSAPRAAVLSKAVAATLTPETQSSKEVSAEAARGVKPIVAKRSQDGVFSVEESSQDGVFSVEESWVITTCGTRRGSFCKVVFHDAAASGTHYAHHLGDGSLRSAHLKTFNQRQLG